MKYVDGRPYPKYRTNISDYGIVLKHGASFDAYGARDVIVWEYESKYYMHYDAADPNVGWLCSLAVSKDLVNWDKYGPILSLGEEHEEDSKSASYGMPYYEKGTWHMFYLGTPNVDGERERVPAFPYLTMKARAFNPEGPWYKEKNIIPFRPIKNSYCSLTASPGEVLNINGSYLQIFSAATESNNKMHLPGFNVVRTLGIARSDSLDSKWVIDPSPMLPINEQIENSSLYYDESQKMWYLFTNHIGIDQSYGEYTDAIWMYWSKDINNWNREHKAIVLDGESCCWSKKVIGLPSVLPVNNRLAIFYDGLKEDGVSHCHRDIGLAWLELPIKIENLVPVNE